MNIPALPQNSKLCVSRTSEVLTVSWKNPSYNRTRLRLLLFALFWLFGWTLLGWTIVHEEWRRFLESGNFEYFDLFWSGMWILAIFWIISNIILLTLGTGTAILSLHNNELRYYPGRPSLVNLLGKKDNHGQLFQDPGILFKDRIYIASKNKIRNLKWIPDGNKKLSIDIKDKRVEIGQFLKLHEKQWLYQTLKFWLSQKSLVKRNTSHKPLNENSLRLPSNSSLKIYKQTSGNIRVVWKEPEDSLLHRIFSILWFGFWLGGWTWGEYELTKYLLQSTPQLLNFENWSEFSAPVVQIPIYLFVVCFQVLFLVFWTTGGVLAFIGLIRLLLGTSRSWILLGNHEIQYKIGREPCLSLPDKSNQSELSEHNKNHLGIVSKYFSRRQWLEPLLGKPLMRISKDSLCSLKLENSKGKLRLILLVDNQRIPIATHLSEVEKEWLYQFMYRKLRLNQ
ncbi:MAG: hypothetical protein F6J87_05215 [Spirulina sp. SIO3F2]|nr:hypothetical protein [Spirulina sp. SIO3F2]